MGNKQIKSSTDCSSERKEYTEDTVLTELNDFRKSGSFCDVKIVVNNTEYPAQKCVLAAFSPYFKAMFSGDYTENLQSTVTIKEIDTDTMKIILEYAYTTNIEISVSNVEKLLQAASIFQVTSLFEACCLFLEKLVDAENCLGMYKLADIYNCSNLKIKAMSYYLMNFTSVSLSKEFLELDQNILIDIISSDSLNVESEEVVFEAVLRWLQYKEEERTPLLPQVLLHVRLALLSPYFLHDRVETLDVIKNSPACMRIVDEAFRFIALPFRRVELQSGITRPRKCYNEVEGAVIFQDPHWKSREDSTENTDLIFISADGLRSKHLSPPPFKKDSKGTFLCNNQSLFAAETNRYCGYVWRYDSQPDTWHQIASMSVLRGDFEFGFVDGFLYAVGGSNIGKGVLDSVERYDPQSNCWTSVTSLPVAVCNPAVVSLKGKMYVLGGTDAHSHSVNVVQCYEARSSRWTLLAPFSSRHVRPLACVLQNRIYLFGGHTPTLDSRSVEVYDVQEDKWEKGTDLNDFAVAAVVLDGRITVVTSNPESVEIYSPFTQTWKVAGVFHRDIRPAFVAGPLFIQRPRIRDVSPISTPNSPENSLTRRRLIAIRRAYGRFLPVTEEDATKAYGKWRARRLAIAEETTED